MLTITESQHKAAKVVGATYLMVLVLSMFAEFYVPGRLIDYDNAGEPERLHALARLAISGHNDAYRMGLLFFGFGSSVFGYLWLKSRSIPGPLAAFGLLGSVLIGAAMFTFVVFPTVAQVITVGIYAAPIFLFELTIGVWLLVKRLCSSPPAGALPARV